MKLVQYEQFTQQLTQNLQSREDIVSLIALGSMAGVNRQPDEWSDHDFFVITQSGVQQQYRDTVDWLPNSETIILHFQETDHGCKVVYADGHLLEYAIFDTDELQLAKVNDYRIILDNDNISQIIPNLEVGIRNEVDLQRRYDTMLANLLVGHLRYARGEELSAHVFVKQYALSAMQELCWALLLDTPSSTRDSLDVSRRFEAHFPGIGQKLNKLMCSPISEAILGLLEIAENQIQSHLVNSRSEMVELLYEQISK